VDNGAKVVKIDLSGATPAEGKIQIVTLEEFNKSYSKVTFAEDAEIASFDAVSGSAEETGKTVTTSSGAAIFYVKKGATLYVTTSAIRLTSAPSVDKDVMTATVSGDATTVKTDEWVENSGSYTAVFEYTVNGAEVGIDMTLTTATS
jgi:hypothetical protein